MKLNTLYDELKDIIVNKNNDYIKMMNFESSTPRSFESKSFQKSSSSESVALFPLRTCCA